MKRIWYEIRLTLAIEMLCWMIKLAPRQKDGLIIISGGGQIAEALKDSLGSQRVFE